MNKEELKAFAHEAAKNIQSEEDGPSLDDIY